jgi:hypothetical protein
MSTTSYLDRFLDPVTDKFTPEVATAIVELRADPELIAEIDELRHKAALGTLSDQEAEDYKSFVEAVDVLSVFQSKARQFLAKRSA